MGNRRYAYGKRTPLLGSTLHFDQAFKNNELTATMWAIGRLGTVRLFVETHNQEHFVKTLAHWTDIGATIVRVFNVEVE